MDELKLIFASNLIRLRTAAGMTQAELGEQLNYSDKSISKWERGEAIPDAAVLKRMSEIFGVTVDYLLDEHDAWQPAPDPADVRDRSHASIIQVALTGIVTLAVLVFVVLWLWLGKVEWVVFPCFVPAALITYLVLNSVFLTDGKPLCRARPCGERVRRGLPRAAALRDEFLAAFPHPHPGGGRRVFQFQHPRKALILQTFYDL